jgi:hypothetical protein
MSHAIQWSDAMGPALFFFHHAMGATSVMCCCAVVPPWLLLSTVVSPTVALSAWWCLSVGAVLCRVLLCYARPSGLPCAAAAHVLSS